MHPDPKFDEVLLEIADYVDRFEVTSDNAWQTARYCLLDSIGCALEALDRPACVRLLGPLVPGSSIEHGARVPGTSFRLDPATAAFNIGAMLRWTDFSDAFITLTTMHPSDDMAAALAVSDYLSRARRAAGQPPLTIRTVLESMIKAHEIQGILGMGNRFSENGIDHALLVRVACAAISAKLLGGSPDTIAAATSLAFFEPSLCVHRFGSNTGPRKGWASADSAANAIRLAMLAVKGEPGYPQVLSHPKWGFEKVFRGGEPVRLSATLGTHVMENVLFKIQAPVVIHAQSAIECALKLHPLVRDRLEEIESIRLTSHARTLATIDKTGPLRNAADRDHCLQYAIAVTLLEGRLTAEDYEDDVAADPRIDALRSRMHVSEDPQFTEAYRDPTRGANTNAIEVLFKDGSRAGPVVVEYPIGHPRRRVEGIPLLLRKFEENIARCYRAAQCERILEVCVDHTRLAGMAVDKFTDLFPPRVVS
jgi:2-methylcitrate dehydratase